MSQMMVLAIAVVVATLVSIGVIVLIKYKRAAIAMDMREFLSLLLRGGGYRNLDPDELEATLSNAPGNLLLVDLRQPERYAAGHIPGAESRPFDDFLRDVVALGEYDDQKDREIVLVCDDGHMSRVASTILAVDEGFSHVYNLRGGMRRWNRWLQQRDGRSRRWSRWPCAACCLGAE